MFTRRAFIGSAAAALAKRKPNIVFILTDDQGYGDLSINGNPHLKTPSIDEIGHTGARFTRFHSSPVCSPTRSSLLTGLYNYRTGVVDTYLGRSMMRSNQVTLPEMLKASGYRSGIFGKWHLGDNYPLRSIDQGFDDSLVLNGGGLLQPGDAPEELTGVKPSYFNPVLSRNGKWEPQKGYCTDIYFREAMRFIDENRERPFFCYIPTNAPHDPLQVAPELAAPFSAMGLDEQTAKVYGMVANIDSNVGKLMRHLKERQLERDTILMFMTDNGPQRKRFNADLRAVKGSVYEGGIRVPLLMRWPGQIAPGTVVDRLAAHIDVAPTLLAASATEQKGRLDGRSLLPLVTGPKAQWRDRNVFLQWHRGDAPEAFKNSAVLTQRYKLVNGTELYDLENDPGEANDIAASEPTRVARMRKDYQAWFRDVAKPANVAPPRILLSDRAPVLLTRQDWRGPNAGWEDKSVGYWEVDVTDPGPYDVTLLFEASPVAAKLKAIWLGEHSIAAGQTRLDLKAIRLPLGPARFEATAGEKGLRYAYFKIPEGVRSASVASGRGARASMRAPTP